MGILNFAKKMVGRQEGSLAGAGQDASAKPSKKKAAQPKAAKKAEGVPEQTSAQPRVPVGIISLTPVLTEKAVSLQMTSNTYAFTVQPDVTKGQIKQAVQATYKVNPVAIRTVQRAPKVRRRGRTVGATRAWKRAYVTLPEGKSIDVSV